VFYHFHAIFLILSKKTLNMSHTGLMSSGSRQHLAPLLHRVDKAIQHSPHLAGRHLILEKQMAQEALRGVEGITEILNQLEVAYSKPRCR
jgi:hypothetical protein